MKALICALLLVTSLSAAGALPSRQQVDGMLASLGADNQFDRSKSIDWGILPGPFFTPELGLGMGMAAVGMYRPDAEDSTSQNSTLALKGFASSTGAFGMSFENYSFFANDSWRFFISGAISDMPTYYWGTGYQAGKNDGNKEKYTLQSLSLTPRLLYRIAPDTYFSLGWDISSSHAKDPQGNLFSEEAAGESVFSSGSSIGLNYDSRDNVSNATRGQVASVILTQYAPQLGSNSHYTSLEAQYGRYQRLSERSVLAVDVYSRLTQGDVPWDRLSQLGDDKHMRGYYEGRYRDRNTFSAQVEYRRKLDWRNGYVLWAGAGTMSSHTDQLGGGPWLPTVGVGYRFEFKPHMNVRLDLGIGRESAGFYFQVGEAF
ncbi:BamA/TamA family outer membrane protein [Edaphovirga cremea]|uniref:BamA/TamA family outer membrane protein n=1 Tax=Edaphovirga cremea TaxID=2267246 RepID=UPI003989B526